ncbi:MAG: helicase-related protein [Chloroherpetonaceae bacterium]
MPVIFDNIDKVLAQALKDTLEVSFRSDFCVGYFNLRGWKQVADRVDNWQGGDKNCCRLLIGMQKPSEDLIREYFSFTAEELIDNKTAINIKKKFAEDFKKQLTLGYPTEEDELGLKRLSKQLKEQKVIVKLFLKHSLHAKLYLMFRNDKINPVVGYLGSSNLTLAGIEKQGELNIDVMDGDASQKLSKWFEDRWTDRWCIDISKELIDIIDNSWAGEIVYSPYHIYLKIAYHLSSEARAGLSQFKIPRIFREQLFDFQQKAVLIAAHHINKRDGVLIGDVVGFGKTFTAAALAKVFQEDFSYETLIICPKNITEMWEGIKHKYELRADVLSITEVQNKLPNLRRYRLVIIDESHNLRNRDGKRYRAIQEYIQLNGSKVILLSATPYNKSYLDLSNQLRLFISEDQDLGISPETYINSLGGKVQFMTKHQAGIRTLAAFEHSEYPDDWRELMRLFLVRRTRSFIKENYALIDSDSGRKYLLFPDGTRSYFPDRIPKKVEFGFDKTDKDDQYSKLYSKKVVDIINSLNLPRYGLGKYINDKSGLKPTKEEETIIANLSRAGKRLMGFCRTNLFKRLESSGYSFLLSITRHILRNFLFIYAIENNLTIPIGQQESDTLDEYLEDKDIDDNNSGKSKEKDIEILNVIIDQNTYFDNAKSMYDLYQKDYKKNFNWIRSNLFFQKLKEDLLSDAKSLIDILTISGKWDAKLDRKLKALEDLISKKHEDKKVLIFTQYADTANYLGEILKKRNINNVDYVTGEDENPTAKAHKFSPVSNEKKIQNQNDYIKDEDEIRVLISTDVLSEGQNLQDGHIIVNYDLPWAIIRLIQRAGRVDRIGQKSNEILCYSFLPEDGLEEIINLRNRLLNRLTENAEVVGTDEIFFEDETRNETIKDLYSEKSGILDEEDDGEVDLASYAYQIWKNATDYNPLLKKTIPDLPDVIYSTKELPEVYEKSREGILVYTRTTEDNDVLAWVDNSGNIITQSQLAILKAAECSPDTKAVIKLENHHELVKIGVEYIKNVDKTSGGQLGKKTGARYRAYSRLTQYFDKIKNSLFVPDELKKSIDDLYKYPLKEFAKDTINRQLKAGINDEQLSELVISLREEDKLSIIDEREDVQKDPQIICSMGLKHG